MAVAEGVCVCGSMPMTASCPVHHSRLIDALVARGRRAVRTPHGGGYYVELIMEGC